ncbi:hypothetical protein BDY17DRAFT_325379 [Neohortaea acidophila]|uniref:Peptidase S54 rhomboid domain-containing protein n=1 Tax=Neohortaea acidophila TaxID=245834 RepID=A0A6A6PP64_9PEZI|nr:uncharacterized protein BDY17DRAFT_325379 [Neohortaea acidophila]KAF2481869.1 hypothetical protein BDY17DRAFT_325379 [Neohortaea acidophila]
MDRSNPNFSHSILRKSFVNGRGYSSALPGASTRTMMWTIIGLNAAVFGAWQYAIARKDRKLFQKLSQNFTVSAQNIRDGRYWTLVTSAFSHQGLGHFAFNMFTFNAFTSIMAFAGVGPVALGFIVLGSGLAGSAAWLYHLHSPGSDRINRYASALGASGAVMGAGAVATCLMPFAPMQMMFIPINIPLWVLTLAYAGLDAYYLNASTGVGHSAHLGGAIFGALFYAAYLRRLGGVVQLLKRGSRRW